MSSLATKLNSMWGATLVICITIVISSLATATAASLINGKNIKKRTVTGNRLKNDTVTGTQIKESTLAKVQNAVTADSAASAGNASTLGGLPPAAFAQGNARFYSASASAGIGTTNNPFLTIPGWGRLTFDCDILGTAYPKFENLSGGTLALVGSTNYYNGVGLPGPYLTSLASNATGALPARDGGTTVFQAWSSASDKNVTVTISNTLCALTGSATAVG